MQVIKFGGSSVANAGNVRSVASIIKTQSAQLKTVVVVSAAGGVTDDLLQLAAAAASGNGNYKELLQSLTHRHLCLVKELLPVTAQSGLLSKVMQHFNEVEDICSGVFQLRETSDRTRDRITAYGEIVSSQILSAYLRSEGLENDWLDARALIKTDHRYGKAAVDFAATDRLIRDAVKQSTTPLLVMPGFLGSAADGSVTTLGRGGSDYTAAIAAAAIAASVLQIWTDVSGMMTADPRTVSGARVIPKLSYHEAMELSHFGAKVVYPPTLQPVMKASIPVEIKNTFRPDDAGTLIESATNVRAGGICGLSGIRQVSLLSLEGGGMVGIPGFSKRLFETLAAHRINVMLITQASSEHSICVGIESPQATVAKTAVDAAFGYEIERGELEPLAVEEGLAVIALVGDNMKSHAGTSGKMFGALGRNGVNIRAIAQGASERNISAVISDADLKKSLNVLHEEFFETAYKQINLFIVGTGNVGSKLLAQLRGQKGYLQNHLRLQIRVMGVANSRRMRLSDEEVDIGSGEIFATAEEMKLEEFVSRIVAKNLRNSVFVDVTANESVAGVYESLLQKSIAVVACNKIACSSPYSRYRGLKDAARDGNTAFLFETNVGAGLPVIGTLNDLLRSGDEITEIQAVLSGTLNFVFNRYDGSRSFADVVRQAQDEGYTEPDPRLDLSGTDVMRKIMILAREAGNFLEMDAITNNGFMPEACMTGDVSDFYAQMEAHEPHFKKLYNQAAATGAKLKFVATYKAGQASVGLQRINPEHEFYHLYGKDNIVLLYTHRYKEQPMVVKGAGAGAEVTASGVFADIIRAARV